LGSGRRITVAEVSGHIGSAGGVAARRGQLDEHVGRQRQSRFDLDGLQDPNRDGAGRVKAVSGGQLQGRRRTSAAADLAQRIHFLQLRGEPLHGRAVAFNRNPAA
jgi:hypothetical protein